VLTLKGKRNLTKEDIENNATNRMVYVIYKQSFVHAWSRSITVVCMTGCFSEIMLHSLFKIQYMAT